jgi:hypothetical protein
MKLIRHCPDKNFKLTRHYGFYSNAYTKKLDHIYTLYGKKIHRTLRDKKTRKKKIAREKRKTKYRASSILSFNRDPIKCKCGEIMVPVGHFETYEKGASYELINR